MLLLVRYGNSRCSKIAEAEKCGIVLDWIFHFMPLFNAFIGVFVARFLSLGPGNALLFVVLCASASYLAVPAAMRMTVPEAKSSFYISTTLGLTFPFNIVLGIPIYMGLVNTIIPLSPL